MNITQHHGGAEVPLSPKCGLLLALFLALNVQAQPHVVTNNFAPLGQISLTFTPDATNRPLILPSGTIIYSRVEHSQTDTNGIMPPLTLYPGGYQVSLGPKFDSLHISVPYDGLTSSLWLLANASISSLTNLPAGAIVQIVGAGSISVSQSGSSVTVSDSGSSPGQTNTFNGIVTRSLDNSGDEYLSGTLTAASVNAAIVDVTNYPPFNATNKSVLVIGADSIMAPAGSAWTNMIYPLTNWLGFSFSGGVYNTAIPGNTLYWFMTNYANTCAPYFPSTNGSGTNYILITDGGINDFLAGSNAAQMEITASNLCYRVHTNHALICMMTVTMDAASYSQQSEDSRRQYNGWLVNQSQMWDYLLDVDSIIPSPVEDPSGYADQIHPLTPLHWELGTNLAAVLCRGPHFQTTKAREHFQPLYTYVPQAIMIGSTNPIGFLNVHFAANLNYSLQNIGGVPTIYMVNDANNAFEPLDIESSSLTLDGLQPGVPIGIGTMSPNPAYELTIVGNVMSSNEITASNLLVRPAMNEDFHVGSFNGAIFLESENDLASAFEPLYLDASSLILNANSGGNVGIGTASPAYGLTINLQTMISNALWVSNIFAHLGPNTNINLVNTASGPDWISENDAANTFEPLILDASPLLLNVNSAGKVGIGTKTPAYGVTITLPTMISNALFASNILSHLGINTNVGIAAGPLGADVVSQNDAVNAFEPLSLDASQLNLNPTSLGPITIGNLSGGGHVFTGKTQGITEIWGTNRFHYHTNGTVAYVSGSTTTLNNLSFWATNSGVASYTLTASLADLTHTANYETETLYTGSIFASSLGGAVACQAGNAGYQTGFVSDAVTFVNAGSGAANLQIAQGTGLTTGDTIAFCVDFDMQLLGTNCVITSSYPIP